MRPFFDKQRKASFFRSSSDRMVENVNHQRLRAFPLPAAFAGILASFRPCRSSQRTTSIC